MCLLQPRRTVPNCPPTPCHTTCEFFFFLPVTVTAPRHIPHHSTNLPPCMDLQYTVVPSFPNCAVCGTTPTRITPGRSPRCLRNVCPNFPAWQPPLTHTDAYHLYYYCLAGTCPFHTAAHPSDSPPVHHHITLVWWCRLPSDVEHTFTPRPSHHTGYLVCHINYGQTFHFSSLHTTVTITAPPTLEN